MGWTFTNKRKDQSVKEFFEERFTVNGEKRVIDCAVVGWHTAYLAYKTDNNGVIGIVCLLAYRPKDYWNFGYKDMTEDMGPLEASAPERIMKLLDKEPINEYAKQWRAKCWQNINKTKAANRPRLFDGCTIKFAQAFDFGYPYGKRDTFKVRMFDRRTVFYLNDYIRANLRGWTRREYTVSS